MLKKQTVWLLTMLCLMIVLSSYYILSKPDRNDFTFEGDSLNNLGVLHDDDNFQTEVTNVTNKGYDEWFAMLRMQIQNERSMTKERYNNIVKSSSASTDEKNDALNKMQEIDQISTRETILQERILASSDQYEDVLVRYSNDKLHVHVRTEDLSVQEANNIMQLARSEFGEIPVEVDFNH